MLLDELTPAGVVLLYFWLEQARCGGPPSLLGCHELRVVEPLRWVQRLQEWSLSSGEPDGREHATPTSDAAVRIRPFCYAQRRCNAQQHDA